MPEFYAKGELRFGALTPLKYDIMGPFSFVPALECRHSVISMRHTVNGWLDINGKKFAFKDADGYIEGDRGRSFPKRYAWTQSFFDGGSLMMSLADIPLGRRTFIGIVCVITLGGREYRLATYLVAVARKISGGEIAIRQRDLVFTAKLLEKSAFPLRAPVMGAMDRTIRENVSCKAAYRLTKGGKTLLDFETDTAAFEFEYP